MTEETPLTTARPKRYPRRVVWFAVILGVLLAFYLIWRAFNTPSYGVIKPVKSVSVSADENSTQQVVGKHVTFSLPAVFKLSSNDNKEDNANSDNLFYTHKLVASSEHLAVGAYPSTAAVTESSSYDIRDKAPDKYTHETTQVDGVVANVFTSISGSYERTAFLSKNNILVSVSFTAGTDDFGNNSKKFDTILASLRIH